MVRFTLCKQQLQEKSRGEKMILEKKVSSKRNWLTNLLLPALIFAIVGFVYFANKTNNVQAQIAEGTSSVIYTNAPLATGTTTSSGVAAPAGTQWSELQNDTGNTTESNTILGTSCSTTTTTLFRCADNFVVPAGQTWTIDGLLVYVYQTGFTGGTSPVIAGTVRIWNGRPGDMGSTVVFGDATTNRLGTSVDSLIWRIGNMTVPTPQTPATNRRVWETTLNVAPALALTEGNYWIDWSTQITASGAHFAPPATVVGSRTQPGYNARQFNGTIWVDALDTGNPASAPDVAVDFPFKLTGIASGGATPQKPNVDYDGDGESDFSIIRDETSGFSNSTSINGAEAGRLRMKMLAERKGQANSPEGTGAGNSIVWYIHNSENGSVTIGGFGTAATDLIVPADFDGDDKTDVAVWRATGPNSASFFIYESATSTFREDAFGQEGDNPQVVGDYDGDGKADVATFRCPPAGGQCFFFYRGSDNNPNGNITYVPWGNGQPFDFFPNVGDFDGDGKNDFCLQRTNPDEAGKGQFVLLRSSDGGTEFINWGLDNDFIIPGDYDGDGKSDFMVRRNGSNPYQWFLLTRTGGGTGANPIQFGIPGDIMTPGDYDGDGKQDISIWRPDANPDNNYYYVLRSSDGSLQTFEWGSQNDVPTANWYVQ